MSLDRICYLWCVHVGLITRRLLRCVGPTRQVLFDGSLFFMLNFILATFHYYLSGSMCQLVPGGLSSNECKVYSIVQPGYNRPGPLYVMGFHLFI